MRVQGQRFYAISTCSLCSWPGSLIRSRIPAGPNRPHRAISRIADVDMQFQLARSSIGQYLPMVISYVN